MLDIKGSFEVVEGRTGQPNIRYVLLFLKDRLLFVRIGEGLLGVLYTVTVTVASLLGFIVGGIVGSRYGWLGTLIGQLGGLLILPLPIAIFVGGKLQSRKSATIQSLSSISRDDLLKKDKYNFEILYQDMLEIEMDSSIIGYYRQGAGSFTVKGKMKHYFDIASGQKFEDCERIFRILLSDKMK